MSKNMNALSKTGRVKERDDGEGLLRTETKLIRFTSEEKEMYTQHAKAMGRNLTSWIRNAMNLQLHFDSIVYIHLSKAIRKELKELNLEKTPEENEENERLRLKKLKSGELITRIVIDRALLLKLKDNKMTKENLMNAVRYELETHSFVFDEELYQNSLNLLMIGGYVIIDEEGFYY